MKKYRLKKDLPFARIGDPVEKRHNDELGVYFWHVYNRNSDEWWQLGCDLLIDADEWIEEVKPREFQLGIGYDGDGVFAHQIKDKSYYPYDINLPGVVEIIKVVEITK